MIESILLGLATYRAVVWRSQRRHWVWAPVLGSAGLVGLAFDLSRHPDVGGPILACVVAMVGLALFAAYRAASGSRLSAGRIVGVGSLLIVAIAAYDSGGPVQLLRNSARSFKRGWDAGARDASQGHQPRIFSGDRAI